MSKGVMYIDGVRVPFDGEKNVLSVIRKAESFHRFLFI